MYRVITPFLLGSTQYNVGDIVASADYTVLESDPHYLQFVVRLASSAPPSFPSPND